MGREHDLSLHSARIRRFENPARATSGPTAPSHDHDHGRNDRAGTIIDRLLLEGFQDVDGPSSVKVEVPMSRTRLHLLSPSVTPDLVAVTVHGASRGA